MATTRKPGKKAKTIPEQLLAELGKKFDAEAAPAKRTLTKGHALIKSMVDAALAGDQRMLGSVLKLIDKLEMPSKAIAANEKKPSSQADWEMLFVFFGKYKGLIEQEIERLKKINPSYWTFDWFQPPLESTPWYEDMYGKKKE
jgi:hypothetical protein